MARGRKPRPPRSPPAKIARSSHPATTSTASPPSAPPPSTDPQPIFTISQDEIGLFQTVKLKDYEDGTLEGLRKWNSAVEQLTASLYGPTGGGCLIDPKNHLKHSYHFTELGAAARERGSNLVVKNGSDLLFTLLSSSFEERYIKPWIEMEAREREELLLEGFAHLDRQPTESLMSGLRKLVPEVVVSEFTKGDGQGLIDFIDNLRNHLSSPTTLAEYPIPNSQFFQKFGIRSDEQLPIGQADRAFQEEYTIKRHTFLFIVVEQIFSKLRGEPGVTFVGSVGNTAREITRRNNPELEDRILHSSSTHLSTGFTSLVAERCTTCDKTAQALGLKKFFYCVPCKKVDRIVPYCSASCQKDDWEDHKSKSCGSVISSYRSIPIISSQPPPSSPASAQLSRLRRLIKTKLDQSSNEIWATERPGGRLHSEGFQHPDVSKQTRIRNAMRALAYTALETADPDTVALLAAALFTADPDLPSYTRDGNKSKLEPCKGEGVPISRGERIRQFREAFEIKFEEDWNDLFKRGQLEMFQSGREVILEYCQGMVEQTLEQAEFLLRDPSKVPIETPEKAEKAQRAVNQIMTILTGRSFGEICRGMLEEKREQAQKEEAEI